MSASTPDSPKHSRWPAIGLVALLALGLLLTVLFGLRALRAYHHFDEERRRPPQEAVNGIAPWMTIPYVAHTYDVPDAYLFEALGIDPQGNQRKNLMQLGRVRYPGERGRMEQEVRAALEEYYAGAPLPAPDPPEPGEVPPPEIAPPPGSAPGSAPGEGAP